MYDGDFSSLLKSKLGAALIGLLNGGSVQDAIHYVTPEMFGAKGDYVIGSPGTPGTGTDDTAAFQAAIDQAIAKGYQEVRCSAKKYLITGTLNLGGTGTGVVAAIPGAVGVRLVGQGYDNTTLYFRSATDTTPLIALRGGSGYHTPRSVNRMTLHPTSDRLYKGYGVLLEGACFSMNYDVAIMKFQVGVHYYNSTRPGTFTEFNCFINPRFHRNIVAELFEVNGGDNSFHGNDIFGGQFQIKTNQDLGDGNTVPGIGIELRGSATTPAYLYNAKINTHFFGGPGAVGIKVTRANTDNITGCIQAEGSLILQSPDGSPFEMKGGLYSIASVTFEVSAEPVGKAAAFIFENRISNTAPFTSPRLPGLNPTQIPLYLADTTDAGGRVGLFRAIGTGIDSPYISAAGTAGNGVYFGYTAAGLNLQGFVPGLKIAYDGGTITSYAASFIIANATTGMRMTANSFEPQTDNSMSSGSNSFRYTTVYAVNSTISTCDAERKTEPRDPTEVEMDAFYEVSQLPWVWQWLERFQTEGDGARVHSGPTVQAAIAVMTNHGLDWKTYSAFCYDEWESKPEEIDQNTGDTIPAVEAGHVYSFRKEELLLWITRAIIHRQKRIEERLSALESK
ncbi:tail protein [Serratia phage vB_SmaA_3M]|uniref:Peptidase S74 domain-containing protein n=1 Tax=Serratia phage vB_SmaA_3M TaxID=2419930 RepID=A0A3G2YS16_9CAUD|nr:tail protein [Serratia phage vB_SmaA_3M]AYP28294.1 hypothetical protein 3M_038 [Serratia phage vB_SmaA_3M]